MGGSAGRPRRPADTPAGTVDQVPAATRSSRVPIIGAALGVVVLLLLVLLAVVLPRLVEGAAAETGSEGRSADPDAATIELPGDLPGFVRVDDGAEGVAQDLQERLTSAEEQLADVYGVPVSVALYSGEDPASQISGVVTALQAPAGLFLPTGPAPDPGLLGLARNTAALVTVDDGLCNVVYGQAVPEGQEVDDSVPPGSVQCQLTSGEVTYQVDGSGMTAQQAVALLEEIAAGQDQ